MSQLNVDDIYDKAGAYKKQQVVQIVNVTDGAVATGSTTLTLDDSIPQITEGNEFMTLAITPKNTLNILVVEVHIGCMATTAAGSNMTSALFQDAITNALMSNGGRLTENASGVQYGHRLIHYMVAGTASEITFRVRAGSASGTTTFNGAAAGRLHGGVANSSITITEYTP